MLLTKWLSQHPETDSVFSPVPKDLKRGQAKKIHDAIRPARGYLHTLMVRMEKIGFSAGDALFECVKKAEAALHELVMALHYMSCEGGMGWNQSESTVTKRRTLTSDDQIPPGGTEQKAAGTDSGSRT